MKTNIKTKTVIKFYVYAIFSLVMLSSLYVGVSKVYAFIKDPVPAYAITDIVVERKTEKEDDRTPIEDFYYRFENDLELRNYITNLKVRRNNPGNLRFADQPGAKNNGGFAEFPNVFLGFRALILQVQSYQDKNHTIRTMLERYSPPSENDTEHLISEMTKRLGCYWDTYTWSIDTITLAQDITRQEFGVKY